MTSEVTCERTLPTSHNFKPASIIPRSSLAPNSPHVSHFEILHNVGHEDSNTSDAEGKTNEDRGALDKSTTSLDVSSALTRGTSSLSLEDTENKEPSPVPLSYPYVLIEDIGIKEVPLSSRIFTDDVYNNRNKSLLPTSVVWVNEKMHGWWPGKIISEDKSEKPLHIQLFGNVSPRSVEVYDTSERYVLPFDSDLSTELRKEGEYPHKDAFNKALSEAMDKETEDNDGLPSEYWALHKVVESPNKRRKLGRKKLIRVTDSNGPNFSKDESLMIPGEPVLAFAKDKYYPARIVSYTEPDKYKVKFCYGRSENIPRKEFYTKYEDGFQMCQLGEFEIDDKENPNYYDPELVEKVRNLEEKLRQVLLGKDELAWRYQHFIEGGKKRSLLAEKVSFGPFDLNEFNMIMRVLISMFAPGIAKSGNRRQLMISTPKRNKGIGALKRSKEMSQSIDGTQSEFNGFSGDSQLRFISDVLLPETIIRLIMEEDEIDYEAAEDKMLTGYREERWVEDLMAERTSFQVGRESLREKA